MLGMKAQELNEISGQSPLPPKSFEIMKIVLRYLKFLKELSEIDMWQLRT